MGYINERKRQISVINTFYHKTLNKDKPQVGVYTKGDIPNAILTEQFVFVLYVRVLPNLVKDNFENYDPSVNEQWYNKETVVGDIR